MPPSFLIKIIDAVGVLGGVISIGLLYRIFLRGPQVYQRPLLYFIIGLIFIIASFILSFFAHHSAGIIHEEMHHLLMIVGVIFFVTAARQISQIGI